MTDAPAVIQGSLVDARNVGAHKCIRLMIDVPVEHGPWVQAAFGWPSQSAPVAVAVARLMPEAAQTGVNAAALSAPQAAGALPSPSEGARPEAPAADPEKLTRPWRTLKLATQAGVRCQEFAFVRFLAEVHGFPGEANPAESVRQWCRVSSRAELDTVESAGAAWRDLDGRYQAWLREPGA